ncbi:pyridoxamine 5'-phosphate oxidase [Oxobacter pfennigii]|uniref:Pyridoxamine 5'-phosphate oxidase n=1 Tax=Oxobacter pfennigii TaxID=36849 RepID=A0A0P8W4G0_9CLOT|nr:pyridoxamine 5'-phosphate oxidase family protein [Oxobacter pfennigii]KPU43476.1 pyridoxamine 5'-phosphate oxidase [Oxobacter pfennigii]
MQRVFDFLSKSGVYHIATVDADGKPHVRPFGSKLIVDGKFYISCSLPKLVYEQLSGQKWLEISAMGTGGEWIRISATAREVTEQAEKEKVYSNSVYVPQAKGGPKRSISEVAFFELTDATATIYGKETKEIRW